MSVSEVLAALPFVRGGASRPTPRVELRTGPTLPSWVLRALSGILAAGLVASVVGANAWVRWFAVGLCVWVVVRPQDPGAALLAVATGLWALEAVEPFSLRTYGLLVGILVLLRVVMLVADLPWRARIEWAVLARAAVPTVVLAAVGVGLGAAAGALDGARHAADPSIKVLGVLALVALCLWLLPRARLSRSPRSR